MQLAEKWQGQLPPRHGAATGASGRAAPRPRLGRHALTAAAGELIWEHRVAGARAQARRPRGVAELADDGAAALGQADPAGVAGRRGAGSTRARRRSALSPEARARRISSREKAGLPRWRIAESFSAIAKAEDSSDPAQHAPPGGRCASAARSSSRARACAGDQMVHPVRLEPLEHRIAVEGADQRRDPRRPRARPRPRGRRSRRTPARPRARSRSRSAEEVLDRGHRAVAGASLAQRRPRRTAARARAVPGSPGREPDVVAERLAVLLGDPLGRVVGVAAGVGPAHVVEQQQRHSSPRPARRSAAAPRSA